MNIRRAQPQDLRAVVRIERASFADPWPASLLAWYLQRPDGLHFVAEEAEVLGFLLALREEGPLAGVHVHNLAVHPSHQGRGVGTALLQAAIGEARSRGASTVRLEVRTGNDKARRFYEQRGFRVVQVLPHYYEDGENAWAMELPLVRPAPQCCQEPADPGQ